MSSELISIVAEIYKIVYSSRKKVTDSLNSMAEQLDPVFADEEEINVDNNAENKEKLEESKIQSERPEICLCQKSKSRGKCIDRWISKFGIIGSMARKVFKKNRKSDTDIQQRESKESSKSSNDDRSLFDPEEAKDTLEYNLESQVESTKDPIVIQSVDSTEKVQAEPKTYENESTTPMIEAEKSLENSIHGENNEREKSPEILKANEIFEGALNDNEEVMKEDQEISAIDNETLSPPGIEQTSKVSIKKDDSHENWKNANVQMGRSANGKRAHKCPQACPCEFSQELIEMFHNVEKLSKDAERMSKRVKHCKFRMTKSEIDFFKQDVKMCNVMIGETRSRRAEMRELMDMWQEANEKMALREKEMKSILESIELLTKNTRAAENLLTDWLPEGKMEHLRMVQRASEKSEEAKMEKLEDDERARAKEKIEEILRNKEKWFHDETVREEKRKNLRIRGLSNLKNATDVMQKYIDKRKSQLGR